jgi:hypothetical protein
MPDISYSEKDAHSREVSLNCLYSLLKSKRKTKAETQSVPEKNAK